MHFRDFAVQGRSYTRGGGPGGGGYVYTRRAHERFQPSFRSTFNGPKVVGLRV